MTNYKLNLQLFAAGGVVNSTKSTELSAEMKTFYDKTLITLASPYLVHDQFGQKRDIPKNGGKIIEFRKFSSLPKALTPLTEGVTPSGKKLSASTVSSPLSIRRNAAPGVAGTIPSRHPIKEASKLIAKEEELFGEALRGNI